MTKEFRYYGLSIAFLILAVMLGAFADWEPLFSHPNELIFFLILFAVGTFLNIDVGGNNYLTLNDAVGYAALLIFGPAFAAGIFFCGMMIHVFYSGKMVFRRLVFLAIGVSELFIAGWFYFKVLGGSFGLEGGLWNLVAAVLTAPVLWIFERVCVFTLLNAAGEKSFRRFFTQLKPYLISVPPLYIWGVIAAKIFVTSGYIYTTIFMMLLLVVYAFFKSQKALQDTLQETIFSLAKMIDARDSYTAQHSLGVAKNASAIAREIGLSEEESESIYQVSLLHDIGKVGIHDSILLKQAPLTDKEWQAMRRHPIIGADLVTNLKFLSGAAQAIRYHHERWDGKGYPFGFSGEDIPLWARIIAICDTWDAMRTDRPYRKALPLDIALKEIRDGKGTQFDPTLVDVALKVFKKNPDVVPKTTNPE